MMQNPVMGKKATTTAGTTRGGAQESAHSMGVRRLNRAQPNKETAQ